jgi:hypothetical protein
VTTSSHLRDIAQHVAMTEQDVHPIGVTRKGGKTVSETGGAEKRFTRRNPEVIAVR